MFDLIIKNGTIIDGLGQRRFKSDIGIKKDKIKVIGNLKSRAKQVVDADNLLVMPGFVDILNHTDGYLTLFNNPTVDSMIMQGVTTMICGHCGMSLAPLASKNTLKNILKSPFSKTNVLIAPSKGENLLKNARRWASIYGVNITWITFEEYLKEIEKKGISCNFGTMVGYNTCRRVVLGDEVRDLTYDEMKILRKIIEDSLSAGALGISLGLAYSHANFIKIKEINKIFSLLKKDRKICSIHLRDEGIELKKSLEEALEIACQNNISVEVSHFKVPVNQIETRVDGLLRMFEEAKEKEVNINFDVYPYKRAWLPLYSYLPRWVIQGGMEKLVGRLKNNNLRSRIIKEMEDSPWNFKDFVISFALNSKVLVGKRIGEIALNQGLDIFETIIELLIANKGNLACFSDDNFISDESLDKMIKNEHSIICSDGVAYSLDQKKEEQLVHPRCFGAFPKFLKKYVVDKKLISWEEALKKITFMPAQKIGLKKRGVIKEKYFADIVIIDPKNITDRATYINPYRYPIGISFVIVNGEIVVDNGQHKKKLCGQVLRG